MKPIHLVAALAAFVLTLGQGAAQAAAELPTIVGQSGVAREAGPVSIIIPESAGTPGGAGCSLGSTGCPLPVAFSEALDAGEAHIGEVGGNAATVLVAQTVTASSAYTSGNAVGGLMTVANAARVAAGSGLLQSVVVYTKSAQTGAVDVFLFNANPTGSTCTDKTALAIAAADFDKIIGVAHVVDWTSGGTPSVGQAQNLAIPFALASGSTIYACAVTRSTPTYSATSDVSVSFRVLRN